MDPGAETMKALTVVQPWAYFIASFMKQFETRSWATNYRGPLAIHAGLEKMPDGMHGLKSLLPATCFIPYGVIVATCVLVDCVKVIGNVSVFENGLSRITDAELESGIAVTPLELQLGDYSVDRYAWILSNVERIKPTAAKGKQRLWDWDEANPCENP